MDLKNLPVYLAWAFVCICMGFCIAKAIDIHTHVEEISEAQKEMEEFLETWRKAV